MVKLHEVQKIYATLGGGQHVLKDIELFFEKGQFVAVLGKSGCGKTTLLNLIGGLDTPSSGQISIDEKLMSKMSAEELDEFRNHKIGIIFQNYNLINHLNVLENVMLSLEIAGKVENKKEKALAILEKVGIIEHANKLVNQLSGGQRQRVSIARALVTNPDIILADEPTGALDSKTSIEVMDLIKEMCKDKLVIFVTHNKKLATTYANRIIEMKDGKVVSDTENIDGRVKIDLNKKLTNNKLGAKSAIKYAFKSAFKSKGKTILIALGLAIGITLITLVDGIFNGAKSKIEGSYYIENNQILYTYGSDEALIEKINNIDGVSEAFYSPSYFRIQALGDNNVSSSTQVDQLLPIPTDVALYNDFSSNVMYGSLPTNDDEIIISYNTMYSLVNSALSEDEMAEYLLNKKLSIAKNYEMYPSDNSLMKYEQSYNEYKTNPNNSAICLKYDLQEYITNKNLVLYEDVTISNTTYNKGYAIINILDQGDYTLVQKYVESFYNEYDFYFGDYDENYGFLCEEEIYADVITRVNEVVNFTIAGILKSEGGNVCLASYNSIKDIKDPYDNGRINIYLDFNKLSNKNDIINEIEGLLFDENGYHTNVYDLQYKSVTGNTSTFILNFLQFVFTAISSVTLITAAIMLWLLLHISVTQRKREIGLLRSMGATNGDVKNIFISETLVIGVLACLISLFFVVVITTFTNWFIPHHAFQWFTEKFAILNGNKPIDINIKKMLIIFGIGILISILAGLVPSSRAGKKKPIESLRGE